MERLTAATPPDPCQVLLETYAVNEHMNQILLQHLDPRVWRAKPPGGKGRTIAGIFAHIHNIRLKWIRLSAPQLKLPALLDRTRCTQKEASVALAESGRSCSAMLASCLASARVKTFLRDGWASAWPAGVATVAYMISHDAHHRGQVCMLARQLGSPLPDKAGGGIWNWEKLWRECGFTHPR